MNFQTLRPLIQAKLEGITQLAQVKDVHTENWTGFPAASHEPSNSKGQFYTNTENLREYAFDIILYQEMTKAGRDAAIANLALAVDAVITAFDSDTTLRVTGGVHFVQALNSEWGEFVSKSGPIKYAKLVLVCAIEIAV